MAFKSITHPTRRIRRQFIAVGVVLIILAAPFSLHAQNRADEIVMYNVQTHKVHKPTCTRAIRCTKNCIPLKRSDAYNRGGVPCKVCGG